MKSGMSTRHRADFSSFHPLNVAATIVDLFDLATRDSIPFIFVPSFVAVLPCSECLGLRTITPKFYTQTNSG